MSDQSSTFTVDQITNSDATTDVPVNYEIDDFSGFRLRIGQAVDSGYGNRVHPKRADGRQPQDDILSVTGKQIGPTAPEQTDSFLAVNEVKASDL